MFHVFLQLFYETSPVLVHEFLLEADVKRISNDFERSCLILLLFGYCSLSGFHYVFDVFDSLGKEVGLWVGEVEGVEVFDFVELGEEEALLHWDNK